MPPTSPVATIGVAGAPNIVWRYKVTSIDAVTGEESGPTASFSCTGNYPAFTAPNVITWVAASGASSYEVYKEIVPGNGVYGLIGVASTTTFNDINIIASSGEQPPVNKTPFAGSGNKPSVVTHFQQRRVFGATNNDPETVIATKTGLYSNLSVSTPLQDDDAVTFSIASDSVNRVMGLVGLRKLIVLTEGGEFTADGDSSGVLTPNQINPTPQSANGAAPIRPLIIGSDVLYVQTGGEIIRNLMYDLQVDGYKGDELTIFSSHLFEGKVIVDWAYSKSPDPIIWVVLDDGSWLGLTYLRAQEVWGWHRHDTGGGSVESVCVIPEGGVYRTYLAIRRLVDGYDKLYIERLNKFGPIEDPIRDLLYLDSSLIYDGYNTTVSSIMTLSGGTLWDTTEDLTLTSFAGIFIPTDVGNQIVLTAEGVTLALSITVYTSPNVVTVRAIKNVAVGFRAVGIYTWSRAVDEIGGLEHLEGRTVGVLADGSVVANGYSEPYLVVTGGRVNLGRPYSFICAGLPIEADLETLSVDYPDQKTMLNKESLVTSVDIVVQSTRGLWVGSGPDDLIEYKQRADEDYGELTKLKTDIVNVNTTSSYQKGGRVFIRQRDPLPVTISAIIPVGLIGGN